MNYDGYEKPLNISTSSTAVVSLVLLVSYGGCAGSNILTDLTGTWGGEHIGMIVSETGATLEYDCAHGAIDEPISHDENGEFQERHSDKQEEGKDFHLYGVPKNHGELLHYSLSRLRVGLA